MLKYCIVFLFVLLGVQSMQAKSEIEYLNIKGVQVPVISERSSIIPVGHVQLIFIGGGNIFNPPKKPLAKVVASLLNYGTKKLGNVGFANQLESKAITLNIDSGNTTLNFNLDFLKEYEDFAYTQLMDLLSDPNITQNTLNDIQTKLHSSLMSKTTDFDYQAITLLNKSIFAKTPLAYPALGNSTKEIDFVTLQDIKDYLGSNLSLSRMIIVIGGDLEITKSLEKLRKKLEFLPQGSKIEIPSYTIKPMQTKILKKDTQQAYIYFASPLAIKNLRDDGYKAQVAGFILGSSGFGSRLMEEIRVKRGLAYSAYMYPNVSKLSNYFMGYMQTSLDKQDEAMQITRNVIKEFVEKGVTQEELDSAKQFIIGNKPLKEETLGQRINAKFMNYYNGLPLNYRDEFVKKVQELDLETLNNFIKSHKEIADLTFAIITK